MINKFKINRIINNGSSFSVEVDITPDLSQENKKFDIFNFEPNMLQNDKFIDQIQNHYAQQKKPIISVPNPDGKIYEAMALKLKSTFILKNTLTNKETVILDKDGQLTNKIPDRYTDHILKKSFATREELDKAIEKAKANGTYQ